MLRSLFPVRGFASAARDLSILKSGQPLKIVGCFYEAGPEAAANPRLLGCRENALGLREFLEKRGHKYVVVSDKEGTNSHLDRELKDADIVISTPFHPAYVTRQRIEASPKLKMSITAGIGSDHIDLKACMEHGLTVAEVTGCNVVSVAEHVIMQILALVRNYIPAYKQIVEGRWHVASIVGVWPCAYDLEGKVVGTVGAGRIGRRVLERLKPFNCKELLYYDYARLDAETEKALGARFVSLDELVKTCDVVTINCPLHSHTEHLFNKELIGKMKKGSYLVNTARGKIVETNALVEALKSKHLAGYAGDVWYPQPAPADHPWRTAPNHAMTPHYSGTTLDAQRRYADGVKDILLRTFEGRALEPQDVIVLGGKLAPQYDQNAKHDALPEQKGGAKAGKIL